MPCWWHANFWIRLIVMLYVQDYRGVEESSVDQRGNLDQLQSDQAEQSRTKTQQSLQLEECCRLQFHLSAS
jgi:ribosomal protein L5